MRFLGSRKMSFLAYMAAAAALRSVPVLGGSLKWYETFCHEISHGLAALLTGGMAGPLAIHPDGSGQMLVRGGWGAVIAFAGYAGAVAWGCLIYRTASAAGPLAARRTALAMAAGCCIAGLCWVPLRDPVTAGIVALIGGSMLLLASGAAPLLARPALRLVGASVMVTAMATPTYVLHTGSAHNDAWALSQMLMLPPVFWVGAWLAWGAACIGLTWRAECAADRRASAAPIRRRRT
jgi:hypothetical protein